MDLRKWLASLKVYTDPRMLLLLVLGFSSGLPRLLVYSTLSFWLLDKGLSIKEVGFFAATSIPYSAKFLWAPLLDRVRLPLLASLLGQRRAWILVTQLGIIGAILGLATTRPDQDPWWTAFMAVCLATCSASHDVVVDAYRVEILSDEEQGAGVAVAVFGYRVAMLVAGAGALVLAVWLKEWALVYGIMGGFMALCIGATLLGPRPASERVKPPENSFGAELLDAVWGPLRDFTTRRAWWLILGFIMLFKLGDSLASTMLNPFLIELGFEKLQIASVAKTYGFAASTLGVFLGGWFVRSLPIVRVLWIAAFMQMFSNLVFILQAYVGPNLWALTATIGVENICGGIGTAAFVAFLSKLCNRSYTATQYALLTALSSIVTTALSSFTGVFAQELGWVGYFMMTMFAALPGLVLLYVLIRVFDFGRPEPPAEQMKVEEAMS